MSASPTFEHVAPSVMARLRSATAAAHARLDASIGLERMCAPRYAAVLRALARAHGLVEAALLPHAAPLRRFDYDLAARSKRAWLDADLRDLDVAPASSDRATWRSLALAEAFGAVYVVEGATLGGRVIARELASAPFLPEALGRRYFSGYGADTASAWRGTRRTIEAFEAWTSGAFTAEIVAGANATFSLFEREVRTELESAGRPALGTRHGRDGIDPPHATPGG